MDEQDRKQPLITKERTKICLVLYSMEVGEQYQAISLPPKEAKKMVNQFRETGKISFLDLTKGFTYDKETDKPTPVTTEVEPYSVIISYVSDFYRKQF